MSALQAPSLPFTECPPVGYDTSCGILVEITDSGSQVYSDPSQGPVDGIEDTLIGVLNSSSHTVNSIALSSDTDLFGFDDDGLCTLTPQPVGCPFGPTGYEGPNTSFSNITPDASGGVVRFTGGLGPGQSAYFTLEEALASTSTFAGGPTAGEQGGAPNPSEYSATCSSARPVNCATGEFWHKFQDMEIPGTGIGLEFNRTYASGLAANDGPLGFGWSDNYNMSLTTDPTGNVVISQENGSTVTFISDGYGGFHAPPRVLADLIQNPDSSYVLTRIKNQVQYSFSAAGQLTALTDRNGNATTLTYSGADLSTVTDPSGRTLTFTFTGPHVSGITDPMGRSYSFNYDGSGDLTSTTDAAGRTWTFSYDPNHLLLTMTDPRGGVLTNTYDGAGRVTQQIDPMGLGTTWSYLGDAVSPGGGTTTMADAHGSVTTFDYSNLELMAVTRAPGTPNAATTMYEYDPASLGRTSMTDPNGNITTNTYDKHGNLLSTTDPSGNTTSYSYGYRNELEEWTTPRGNTTYYNYDAQDNLVSITDPMGNMTELAYADPAHPGDITSITDPLGRAKAFEYDTQGDVSAVKVNPSAGVTNTMRYVYDADGERVCEASPNATASGVDCPAPGSARVPGTTTATYDDAGEVTSITDPSDQTSTYSYDLGGDRTDVTTPDGNTTSVTFDADGRPVTTTRGAGTASASTTTLAYDVSAGTGACSTPVPGAVYCSTTTDENGHLSVYYHDSRDQLIQAVSPGGSSATYGYDLAGNETTRADALGRTTDLAYDQNNRLENITYSDGHTPAVTYAYDEDGNRVSMQDGTGTTKYGYDANGRVATIIDGAGHKIQNSFDDAGDLTAIRYPSGDTVKRYFDGAGELSKVVDWSGYATRFGYDSDGNPTSTFYRKNTVASTFDPNDQLKSTQVALKGSPASPLMAITYTRSAEGQILQEADTGASPTNKTFAYDAKYQLTQASSTPFGYDPAGNLVNNGGSAQTFDPSDQIKLRTVGTTDTSFTYDPVGERTGAAGGATASYGYDQAQHLASASAAAGTTRYSYNGDGLRMVKKTPKKTEPFSWDIVGSGNGPALLTDGRVMFLYGPDGLPIEQMAPSGKRLFFFHDGLGSTRSLLDFGTGAAVSNVGYTPYGAIAPGTPKPKTRLLFTGGYRDGESGLYYLINRYYDPSTAQFLTIDPAVGLTQAPYSYANGDPINITDPLGLWGWDWGTAWKVTGLVLGTVALATGVGELAGAAWVGEELVFGGAALRLTYGTAGAIADLSGTALSCAQGEWASCALGVAGNTFSRLGKAGSRLRNNGRMAAAMTGSFGYGWAWAAAMDPGSAENSGSITGVCW